MASGVRVVVLAEDQEHRRFALRVLTRLGWHPREIRFLISPSGRGAADKWVELKYSDEVIAHRQRAASQKVALLVFTDADKLTVVDRERRLAGQLEVGTLAPRGSDEQIVLWIPRRHVETWVVFCLRNPVNEEDDYKADARGADYCAVAAHYVNLFRAPSSGAAVTPPSLTSSFEELRRIV